MNENSESADGGLVAGMPGWFVRVDRVFGRCIAVLNALGTLLIAFIMVIVNLDIAGRFILNTPLTGTTEMVIVSIAAIVFLQFAHTLRSGRVIQADTLLRVLAVRWPRVNYGLMAIYCVVGTGVFLLLVHATLPFLERALSSGDMYGNPAVFALPKWPVRLIAIIGSAAMALQFLLLAIQYGMAALFPAKRSAA